MEQRRIACLQSCDSFDSHQYGVLFTELFYLDSLICDCDIYIAAYILYGYFIVFNCSFILFVTVFMCFCLSWPGQQSTYPVKIEM